MRAKLTNAVFSYLRQRRLLSSILPITNLSSPSLNPNWVSLFCTLPSNVSTCEPHSAEENGKGTSLSWRIESLPRGEPVGSAFRSWMGDGFPVRSADIFHSVNRLRKMKANKRALEVMEWVIRERPYKLKELDYSFLLEFTIKIHGPSQGDKIFNNVPSEFQNELLYNNLVISYLEKGLVKLSLAYMKKMRELGHTISHIVFNRLIILHSSLKRRKHIPRFLAQMKSSGVHPHVSTFNILMKMEANDHNLEGLARAFDKMKQAKVEPNEVSFCILATAYSVARLYTVSEAYVESIESSKTGNNWSTYDILLMLYGYLGKLKDLERTWGIIQEFPNIKSKSYILGIEAFGRIGELTKAEDLWLEMKAKKGLKLIDQYNAMISVYCKHGLVTKATKLYREIEETGCKPNAITFRHLALGCLRGGLLKETVKTLEIGMGFLVISKIRKSTPWLQTTFSIMEIFAENGDVENANKCIEELKYANYTRYSFVYNTLIKAYVKGKVYNSHLLKRMILGGARPDSETYALLKLVDQFQT
ncbi:pentatricopeptide repeat-containing protein At1g07590, mitochondrial [Impatiens glandulifera]|uniref:pentatricopeptide repeat-containing protein At1g07590, mitochondrial n=1 Tax=Impatiens glandulifera TaxID=253017 RepID=UPI001FB155F1|nr:pentatricopeptide repeat-containing protein At1g07590, mitochondrial [Impatiens glandulifera]